MSDCLDQTFRSSSFVILITDHGLFRNALCAENFGSLPEISGAYAEDEDADAVDDLDGIIQSVHTHSPQCP